MVLILSFLLGLAVGALLRLLPPLIEAVALKLKKWGVQ